MRHFVPLNGIQWLTLLLLLAVVAGFAYGFGQQHDTNLKVAEVQAHQNDALRSIFCFAEHTVKVRPGIPHKQREQALAFYQHALEHAHLEPCP